MSTTIRILALLLGVVIGGGSIWAKGPEQAAEPAAVWRIEGPVGTIYLAGSVHLLRASDYPLPRAYERAWAATETLILEIDPVALTDARAVAAHAHLFTDPERRSVVEQIRHIATPQQLRELEQQASELMIPLGRFDGMQPWFAAITVMQMVLMREGFNPQLGVDQHYAQRALAAGRETGGLETLGEQFSMLAGLSDELQLEFLLSIYRDADSIEEDLAPMLTAWRAGDTEGLAEVSREDMEEYPELQRVLLTDRNRRWFSRLERMLEEPRQHFVIVGALHLSGEDGLLEMFERAGYSVEQL